MALKTIVLSISALLVQSIAGRCITPPPSCGCKSGSISIGSVGCNRGASEIISVSSPSIISNANSITSNAHNIISSPIVVSGPALASSGGAFFITSIGPVAPSGIRVDSTNELYGELLASGTLPYLTAVAFEGSFANNGVASVSYGYGDGEIAITEVINGAAQYNNGILPAATYNSDILSAPSSARLISSPCNCGCAY